VTVGYGLFGVGALPGGILVDRFGSKPLIIRACLGGMAGSFLLVSLAPNLLTLALAIAVWGSLRASITRRGCRCSRSRSISAGLRSATTTGSGNLGIALGPLATALLLLAFDWRIVTAALTVPAAVVAAYGLTVDIDDALPDTENAVSDGDIDGDGGAARTERPASLSTIADDTRVLLAGGFLIVFVFVTFSGLYYRTFLTFLPDLLGDVLGGLIDIQLIDPESPYAEEFDVARYLYVAVLMVGVLGQYLGGRIADRVPPERALMVLMGILTVLALLFVPASETIVTFIAVSLLLGVVLFTVQPLSQATVAGLSPSEARGISFGYTYLRIFGFGSLGAALAGTVLTRAGPRELFFVLAGIAALGAPSPRPESLGSRRGRTDGRNADNPERFVFGRVFRAVATGAPQIVCFASSGSSTTLTPRLLTA